MENKILELLEKIEADLKDVKSTMASKADLADVKIELKADLVKTNQLIEEKAYDIIQAVSEYAVSKEQYNRDHPHKPIKVD